MTMPPRPTLTKTPPTVDTDKLLVLFEQWTRADVMSRIGPLASDICYATTKVEKENEIKTLLYGTCSLVELGVKWGMVKNN